MTLKIKSILSLLLAFSQDAVQLRIKNEYSLPCPNAFFRLRRA